jgi:glycopeptide antibiotics resistance protein
MLLSLGILIVLLIFLRHKRRWAYLFCFSLFWLYLMVVASLVFFPVPLVDLSIPCQPIDEILARINWTPFNFRYLYAANSTTIFEQVIGNVLLTIPIGLMLPLVAHFKAGRRIWLAAGVGFIIETMQLAACLLVGFAYRGIDINDVMLNGLGALLGYLCFHGLARLVKRLPGPSRTSSGGLFAYIHSVALAGDAAPESRNQQPSH